MDNKIRIIEAFNYIKSTYGTGVIYSPEKVKAILLDLAPDCQNEIKIFINVLYQTDIVKMVHSNLSAPIEHVITRIIDSVGMSNDWATESAVLLFEFFDRGYVLESLNIGTQEIDDLTSSAEELGTNLYEKPMHTNPIIDPLLKRVYMFLEDGDFASAETYCEKVLDLDPQCVKAYLVKFMVENRIRTETELATLPKKYDTSSQNLKKALAFATPEERKQINQSLEQARRLYDKTYSHLKTPQKLFNLLSRRISCGQYNTSILLLDGRVIGTGQINSLKTYNLASIQNAQTLGNEFNQTIKPYGTFLIFSTKNGDVMEMYKNTYYDRKIQYYAPSSLHWNNIVMVDSCYHHTVGLKKDGTAIAAGDNIDHSCDVTSWTDLIDVSCGIYHTVGLRKDGTVVACGASNYYNSEHWYEVEADKGQCNIGDWEHITGICCSGRTTYGVTEDGRVCVAGEALEDTFGKATCLSWTDVVGISASSSHVVGVKGDGTVVACGSNACGQCNVTGWRDVIVVACGDNYTVGIKKDGTILTSGANNYGQCDISRYKFFLDEEDEKKYYQNMFLQRRSQRVFPG